MAKQRRNNTREFKTEAVRRIAAEGKGLAEVGLGESLLRSWKTALAADGEQAFPGKGSLPAVEEELRRLRAENQNAPGTFSNPSLGGSILWTIPVSACAIVGLIPRSASAE